MISDDLERALIEEQIKLLDRTIEDISRERKKAQDKLWRLRNPPMPEPMIRLACRHLDPNEGVMTSGHVVGDGDVAALQRVLDYVAARLEEE